MSFKNLSQLYEEKVAELYKHNPDDWNTGEPLYLNKLKPGPMSDKIKYDSRSLPITSTIRDGKRLVKYTLSSNGMLELANQQLMQTGNYFAYTSILNPAFIISNAVPFLHSTRHLSGFGVFKPNPKLVYGRLQKSTGKVARQKAIDSGFDQISSGTGKSEGIRAQDKASVFGLVDGVKGLVSNIKSNLDPDSTVYEEGDRPDIDYFDIVLPPTDEVTAPEKDPSTVSRTIMSHPSIITKSYDKNFVNTKSISTYESFRNVVKSSYETKLNPMTGEKTISYMNDQEINSIEDTNLPSKPVGVVYTEEQERNIYKFTNNKVQDFINVFIGVPSKSVSVQFRSFIKNLKINAKPVYNEARYLGRTDKYITYSGATRTASFQLTLLAFSQEEINGIYTRLNYLQGLTFPIGFATGQTTEATANVQPQLMQPPMVDLTIGNVLVNQPGYFTNVDIEFFEKYDIVRQVPFMATVNIAYTIIEKESMLYNYPMMGLMESKEKVTAENIPSIIAIEPRVVNYPAKTRLEPRLDPR